MQSTACNLALIKYLTEYFYTGSELLNRSNVSESEFIQLQMRSIMPKASYKLDMSLTCHSYFGSHASQQLVYFYPKAYAGWLKKCVRYDTPQEALTEFARLFYQAKDRLSENVFWLDDTKIMTAFDEFIAQQWPHFLAGTYGVCTKRGSPFDILSKELAVTTIRTLLDKTSLSVTEQALLSRAVSCLKKVGSQFAPHERALSQQHQLLARLESLSR
ncbi:DUF6058 family natural product biosynthesis protein [Pseudoalteromonas luteoviolacea]|uniref:DUF6058 family natural product biosynthesis protein n=1 Tax=Pseudoalteromonas luteoviolacea TaxID=43657 RepID=UPI001F2D99A8|nr:DUF6058 family natural product biosynthesis protein [Pseudoalteromonas luteoviolacea]MCF6439713.1 DUF6058 family natural product biosynthesis protein [Pseudoalteromonas luteoviolacea]